MILDELDEGGQLHGLHFNVILGILEDLSLEHEGAPHYAMLFSHSSQLLLVVVQHLLLEAGSNVLNLLGDADLQTQGLRQQD